MLGVLRRFGSKMIPRRVFLVMIAVVLVAAQIMVVVPARADSLNAHPTYVHRDVTPAWISTDLGFVGGWAELELWGRQGWIEGTLRKGHTNWGSTQVTFSLDDDDWALYVDGKYKGTSFDLYGNAPKNIAIYYRHRADKSSKSVGFDIEVTNSAGAVGSTSASSSGSVRTLGGSANGWVLNWFDAQFYLDSYGDLQNAFGDNYQAAYDNWTRHGIGEGRRGSPGFDFDFYLDRYADVRNAFGSNYGEIYDHWIRHGIDEGRRGSLEFDANYYLSTYEDVRNAFGSDYGAAYNHWLRYGIDEGCRGSLEFDVHYYLNAYQDLKNAFGNDYRAALLHWITHGIKEGRRGSAP